jgi:small-conductance mechanosensitive channel
MVLVLSPRTFFEDLSQKWLSDLQNFLHHGLPKLIFISLLTWALVALVNFITDRIMRVAESRTTIDATRANQIRTLASVVRATGIGVVVFLAILQVMESVFNLNLAPLLASAGIAGVAVGLAAQTMVKDVLNGIFVLVEDQYTVGETVTLAGITGAVEAMSLRVTTIRGADGTRYSIPNSQITTVANQNRGFSLTSINISVDFSADPNDVMHLLKEVAMSVRNDPAYEQVFLDDPKVLGVDSIKGSEIIYPIQVRTTPRQQFEAVREIQRRIRLALQQHNMLPGSPYRIANHSPQTIDPSQVDAAVALAPPPNPTAAKPNETNPFAPS